MIGSTKKGTMLMDNRDIYSERISIALKERQKWQAICFGAWSVFPFTKDKRINE
ncbi:MAG: hypothetical protein FWG14_11335 [Peptococcaceae bacterium]|nr:hypothetical protein [Peptococcaceae bacterium]